MSYSGQLAKACMLHKALVFILDKIMEIEADYPDFKDFIGLATEGLERNIHVKCPHDHDCVVQTTAGGIPELITLLEGIIEELTQEVEFGEVTMDQALRDTEEGNETLSDDSA